MGSSGGVETGSTLSKDQKGISKDLAAWLRPQIGQPAEGWGPTGQLQPGEDWAYTAPMSGLEQQAQGAAQTALSAQPMYTNALQQALAGINPQQSEEWFRQYVQPAMERTYTQEVAPRITESYIGPGNIHSEARAKGESEGAQRFGEGVNQALYDAIMQGRQQAYSAIPMGMQAQVQPMQMAQAAGQMGALPRALQQQEIVSRLQEFMRTRPEAAPAIQQALAYLGTNQLYGMGQRNPLAGALGSTIGAAGSIGAAFV